MAVLTAFRAAAYDTPWWVNPNRTEGRWHRDGDGPTQYWALHPLAPAAELLRALGPDVALDLDTVRQRLWVARVPDDGVARVGFGDAEGFGLRPGDLVAESRRACQDLAARLRREGAAGLRAPSAALPGTETLVLFGPRLLHPYLAETPDPEQVPTAHAADGPPAAEVVPLVRWRGTPHRGLAHWRRAGTDLVLRDPPVG